DRSRVSRTAPVWRAVAATIRSAGSRGGLPGKNEAAISTDGPISARLIPPFVVTAVNHRSISIGEVRRPLATSIPISQAEIGEARTARPARAASVSASAAGADKLSSAAQMSAHVSNKYGVSIELFRTVGTLAPVGVGRLSQVDPRCNCYHS